VKSDEGLMLALQAGRWHVRPSELAGVSEPLVALALDEALAERLAAAEVEQARRSKNPSHGWIEPGQRYEEPSDIVH
jgi:hypothetical protein